MHNKSNGEPWETHAETSPDRDERRWDIWAWVTLAIGLALVLVPLLTSLAGMSYLGDGWVSTAAGSIGGVTGPYVLTDKGFSQPSPLQRDDIILAINGRPLTDNSLPPAPADVQEGELLRYQVARGEDTLDIEVEVVRLTPAALAHSWTSDFSENPGNPIFSLLLLVLGVAVFLLRPGNLAARYLYLFVMFGVGNTFLVNSGVFLKNYPAWMVFLWHTFGWGWVYIYIPAITLIVLSFPVRKWPVRRFPRLTLFVLIGLPFVISIIANSTTWFGGILRASELLMFLMIYSIGLMLAIVPATLIHNLITIRDPLPRAQMRWIALGFGVGFLVPTIFLMLNFVVFDGGERWTQLGNVALIAFPLSLAIGILRYRLFDIDVIIRRTTSYALITAILGVVYFSSVVILQRLLTPLTGRSDAAVVLSTLLIAALFMPIRRRVQDAIDRRFNRTRYNAEKTLESFAATVRNETDLDALTVELLRVIHQTMEPESMSMWLRKPESIAPEGTFIKE